MIAALLLIPGATDCYVYTPLWNGTPSPGSEVSLGLSDRGRAALAGPLGPGPRLITGQLAAASDSAYVIKVHEVTYVDGGAPAKWNGEPIAISKDFVSGLAERRLAKGRSWVAAGIAVGVLGLATTIAIRGSGGPAGDTKVSGPPQTQ